jgi:23S rRNA (uracil1939-C5)-methyltransferase
MDMTGNVDEWVINESGMPYKSGLKGGYWGPVRDRCRPMTTAHYENFIFYQIGFRCCADTAGTAGAVAAAPLLRRLPVLGGDFTFPSGAVTLSSGAGVFGQNNLALNPRLVRRVVEFAGPGPRDSIADIYCGVGNYSIPLALVAGRVKGVENNRRAVLYGEENARAQGLANITFIPKTAREAFPLLPPGLKTLVINPPRVGAADITADIVALRPERIVYVSCNPATLARDLAVISSGGYRVARLSPFDMFPQTHHLETVALLEKGDSHLVPDETRWLSP